METTSKTEIPEQVDPMVMSAAQRLRENTYVDGMRFRHPCGGRDLWNFSQDRMNDTATVAEAWMHEHPADDELEPDISWLVSIGWDDEFEDGHVNHCSDDRFVLRADRETYEIFVVDGWVSIGKIPKTRRAVRDFCKLHTIPMTPKKT